MLFKLITLPSEEPVLYVGTYVLKWGLPEPTVAFIPATAAEIDAEYGIDSDASTSKVILKRFQHVFSQLVDETENPLTLHDRVKNNRLKDLLELFAYINGEDTANPMIEWFVIDEEEK